jgi:hypothetical protein
VSTESLMSKIVPGRFLARRTSEFSDLSLVPRDTFRRRRCGPDLICAMRSYKLPAPVAPPQRVLPAAVVCDVRVATTPEFDL